MKQSVKAWVKICREDARVVDQSETRELHSFELRFHDLPWVMLQSLVQPKPETGKKNQRRGQRFKYDYPGDLYEMKKPCLSGNLTRNRS